MGSEESEFAYVIANNKNKRNYSYQNLIKGKWNVVPKLCR